jgi:hypothetical protein
MDKIQYTRDLPSLGTEADAIFKKIAWEQNKVDIDRWNKYYPYKLVIAAFKDGVYWQLWEYILPIPPQELSIDTAIATNVQATLNGIIEFHNGAPFRDITLSGTTGFTPIKNSSAPQLPDVLGYIMGGAINDLAAINPFRARKNNINKGIIADDNINEDFIPQKSTGYYQFQLLRQFLERYLEIKKTNVNVNIQGDSFPASSLRLALKIAKDQAVYLSSGVSFSLKRSATSPLEYTYSLKLKAWKRIIEYSGMNPFDRPLKIPSAKDANLATNFLNALKNIQTSFDAISDTLNSIGQGFAFTVSESMRQINGSLKGFLGAQLTVLDMPSQIFSEIQTSMMNEINDVNNMGSLVASKWNQFVKDNYGEEDFGAPPPMPGKGRYNNGPAPRRGPQTTPLQTLNTNLTDFYRGLALSDLALPPATKGKVRDYQDTLAKLTRNDFEKMRQNIQLISSQIYELKPNLNDDETKALFALNDLSQILDYLAMSRDVDPPKYTSLEYIAGLAERSGIAFTKPVSKFPVPFPYNHTLEQVAQQYLGSANRWHEIAALNGLRAPYVDEVGFVLPFLTNGDGRKCYVSSKENLYIGQYVWISSINKKKSKRQIYNIRELYEGFVEIELSGDTDLDTFLTAASANLQAFLPGTVNSQQLIYIPSTLNPRQDPKIAKVPAINELDPLLDIGGMDLLLTPSGDLAITPTGDCKLAYGMQNIVQRVKLALSTRQGELINHPGYGLTVSLGDSVADLDIKDLSNSIIAMFENDPTFKKVASLNINQIGPTLKIDLVLELQGVNQTLPISFGLDL